MGRYSKFLFGPAGVCDACGRFCCTLDQAGGPEQAGIRCYHCGQGRFRHRSCWYFWPCPACRESRGGCVACSYSGMVAVPREGAVPVP